MSSAGSNNSVIDVEATIAQQRLNAEAAAAASSAHSSESSHQPQSTTAYSDLIDLTVPVAPASEVITQAPPQQPLPAPPVPPIKQSESAHLLELESFFDELSFGINNIASVSPTLTAPAATWATSSNNSPGVVGAGADAGAGVLSKPTSLVSLSGGADQSSHNNSSSAAELGLFDDMLIGTAAAQPSVSAKPEQPVSTTMIAPAITAPVPKSDEDLALSTSGAGVTAAATTAAAPAPSKKSLTGNIQVIFFLPLLFCASLFSLFLIE